MLVRDLPAPSRAATSVDFDLHGFVGIRLLGASEADVAAVTRQLGPIRRELQREPDIVIRFVERLDIRGARLLAGEAAFTDAAFLVLLGRHKTRVRVAVPMAEVGGACEIVCERGIFAVPLLIPIVNLTALAKQVLPLHASAFVHRGKGVLVTGWAKGGKTEALLAFMAHGAAYVGDEWVYVSADGRRMYGIPEPITLWDWHLDERPEYRDRLQRSQRARLRAARIASAQGARAARRVPAMSRWLPLIERQGAVHAAPAELFGVEERPLEASFDRLFFVMSHEDPRVAVEQVDPADVARRMVFSLLYERTDLLTQYMRFRFAFPDRRNPLIESLEQVQRDALHRVLADRTAHQIAHPYPVGISALHRAMDPLI
jgi:hypothetical protein